MKLVGYLRVSTDRQAEQGFGLSVQQDVIDKWVQTYGHELIAVMRDVRRDTVLEVSWEGSPGRVRRQIVLGCRRR